MRELTEERALLLRLDQVKAMGVPDSADPHQLERDIYERTAPKLTPEIFELAVPSGAPGGA